MANDGKFLNLENGKKKLDSAIASSAGAGDASKVLMTDGTGRIDSSFLPVGIGADTQDIISFEDLVAGDFVNIFDDGGTPKVRKADASNGRDANGFVLSGVTAPALATVYFEGTNTQLSAMTPGARQYLDTAGGVTETPNTTSGQLHQYLGKASSATELNVELDDCVLIG
jgi:hypothetical protein